MKVYSYDEITFDYVGIDKAFESPRRPGTYLIPANATVLEPPQFNKNQTCKFINDKWIVEDIIVPEPIPVLIPTIDDVRIDKLKELSSYRYSRETSGLNFSGSLIATDRISQTQLSNAYISLKNGFVTSIDWKTDNGWIVMTLADIEPIAQAVAQYVQKCFSVEKNHVNNISNLTSIDEIKLYDFTIGWD